MPATLIDSAIFGDIFSTAAMRRVWSDENRTAKYLQIEAALARVQGRLGLIPAAAADEIVHNCVLEKIDLKRLKAQTERIGYPVLGVASQLNALCRDGLGEYCHWGATTQDITDTATVLQVREARAIVDAELGAIGDALARLAKAHRDTPMVGRSNLQRFVEHDAAEAQPDLELLHPHASRGAAPARRRAARRDGGRPRTIDRPASSGRCSTCSQKTPRSRNTSVATAWRGCATRRTTWGSRV